MSQFLLLLDYYPVDWFPWGDAAFEKARREDKPIFLSIGYSTCHWCYVMESESFSDPAMAAIMNEYFVSIKVDREERPDIDRVYMSFVQATTGSGGWPMTTFLTPDLKPFFGGTYYPPEDRYGRPGLRTLLQKVHDAWATQRNEIAQSAEKASQFLQAQIGTGTPTAATALGQPVLDRTYQQIKGSYDATLGGFGAAPKFPRPVIFNFLVRYYARTRDKAALEMTVHTLRAMARGGMHDQLGSGFHRYSTDASWHVPHFEKMLDDQAQLAMSYTDAYQITKEAFFAEITRDILDYVLRDMRGPEGGFYSAENADSLIEPGRPELAEGAFYAWTADQIRDVLGDDRAALFNFHYGVEPSGNVPAQQDIQGELKGKNVLIVRHTLAETAVKFKKSEDAVRVALSEAREKLVAARASRSRPSLDNKVLVAWNGLMISAFARAAQVLDEARYLEAARAAAGFIEARMYDSNTNLLKRRYREGHVDIDAVVEDYAFLIQALIDLYETSFDVKWLSWAVRLQAQQDTLFVDGKAGGYFATRADASHVLVRMKDDYDGAEPSPNSVAAMNLLRLWQMTDRQDLRKKADVTFAALAGRLGPQGAAVPQLVAALDFSLSKPKQIVIAGEPGAADTRAMLRLVHDRFIPNKILLLADGGPAQQQLAQNLPFLKGVSRKDSRATAYICENYVCRLPTADLGIAAQLLDGTWKPGSSE
ncbi:MAG: thioredoxin domain-containing protein [Acidobacteria bacterium]|nr:thioredoxin domain-containing protein [Acidobacteriota bacterium]